jgi:tRNA/rRNA methyltransferase
LYELVRGRKTTTAPAKTASGKKEKTPATSREVERLTQATLKVLRDCGYVKPRAVAAEEKLRRLVWRMALNSNDAEVWLGMLRQIAWKLGANEKNDK